jgi:hypothetical protein
MSPSLKLNSFIAVIFFTSILSLLFFTCEKRPACGEPVDIAVGNLNMQSKLTLWIDDVKKGEFFTEFFHGVTPRKDVLVSGYCSPKKQIKIKCQINLRDTTFYVNREDVFKIFVGDDIWNRRKVDVRYFYRDSYKGDRSEEMGFE